MNIAYITSQNCMEDKFFNEKGPCNRDRKAAKWLALKKELEKKGHEVRTADMYDYKDIDVVIILYSFVFSLRYLFDIIKANPKVKILYHMFEPELAEPLNNKDIMKNWDIFDKIFTYRDDFVGGDFIKLHMHNYPDIKEIKSKPFSKKKFMCLMNAMRTQRYPKSKLTGFNLYDLRIKLTKYFAKKKLLDIYGLYWDTSDDKNILRSYKGLADDKKTTFSDYKFILCFENEGGVPGYISEKIIDCFDAGTVPIYYGASNITDYFPKDMFIDYTDFSSVEELEDFLKSMKKSDYDKYIGSMKKFIKSKKYDQFKEKEFVKTMMPHIKKSTKKKSLWKIKLQFLKVMVTNPYISYHAKKRGFLFYTLTKW